MIIREMGYILYWISINWLVSCNNCIVEVANKSSSFGSLERYSKIVLSIYIRMECVACV